MPVHNNQEIVKASEDIESILAKPRAESLDVGNICDIYKELKKPLLILLPVIRLMPIIGTAVAGGLEMLMKIADHVCRK